MEWVYYMKMRHGKSRQLRPLVTVVLVGENGGPYHRGMSICSVRDNPWKVAGKAKAKRRVLQAIKAQVDVQPIKRREAFGVLAGSWAPDSSITGAGLATFSNWYKGAYDVKLAPFEEKMVGVQGREEGV